MTLNGQKGRVAERIGLARSLLWGDAGAPVISTARDVVARCRDLMAQGNERGEPEFEAMARKVEADLVLIHRRIAGTRLKEVLAHLPPSVVLTAMEKIRLARVVEEAVDVDPAVTWPQLLWGFALDGVRPRARGRKAKWGGLQGLLFVADVEFTLRERGWTRTRRKELRRAIDVLRKAESQRYAKYTEDRLRAVYYGALPRYLALAEFAAAHNNQATTDSAPSSRR